MGADGDWSTGAAAVNSLIDDLVRPTTEVARVIAAVAEGDLSQQMALEIAGQPVKGEFALPRPVCPEKAKPALVNWL